MIIMIRIIITITNIIITKITLVIPPTMNNNCCHYYWDITSSTTPTTSTRKKEGKRKNLNVYCFVLSRHTNAQGGKKGKSKATKMEREGERMRGGSL